MNRFLYFIIAILFCASANASPLVADLSNYQISMDSGFNGTKIFVFGTRNDTGDIVVVVRGENKDYLIRKKEEFAGVWVNRDHITFRNLPNFYAIASSKNLSEINKNILFTQLGIGEDFLLSPPAEIDKQARFNEFKNAFLNYQHSKNIYNLNMENINFMGETLFKTVVDFGDNIPTGNYTAEIYLISDGEVVGMQSTPISVEKTGLDAFIYNFAHNSPILYGVSAVLFALAAGWFAGRIFETKS